MNYQRNGLGVAIAAVLALAGCGTAVEQDKGVGTSTAFHARIVDGYLAGSLVFVDSNDNGVLDAWEERAFTDRDGFVSASGSGKDYCAAGAQPTDAVHCLKVRPADALKIRASGGYDMSTGEPFNGALSLDTTRAAGSDSTKPVVTSPLTTLLASMDEADRKALVTKLGLSLDVLNADFIKIAPGGTTTTDQRKALTTAMQVHKLVEVMSSFLTAAYAGSDSTYSGLGKNANLPRDASEFVYAAFAEQLASSSDDVDHVASSSTAVGLIVTGAETKVRAQIAAVTKKPLAEIVGDAALMAKLADRAGEVSTLGSTTAVLFSGATEMTSAKVDARLRAINIIVAVARDSAVDDARVKDALDATGDAGYMTNLESPKVDMAQLVTKFKQNKAAEAKTADFSSRVSIESALKIPDALGSSTKLNLAESGKGDLSMDFKTTAVDGAGKATGGTLALDVKSFSGSDLFKKEAGSTEPTSVPGTWEKLNDYSLLVTFEPIPGVKQQAVVKPTQVTVDGVVQTKYFFDYGGKQIEWGGAVPN